MEIAGAEWPSSFNRSHALIRFAHQVYFKLHSLNLKTEASLTPCAQAVSIGLGDTWSSTRSNCDCNETAVCPWEKNSGDSWLFDIFLMPGTSVRCGASCVRAKWLHSVYRGCRKIHSLHNLQRLNDNETQSSAVYWGTTVAQLSHHWTVISAANVAH